MRIWNALASLCLISTTSACSREHYAQSKSLENVATVNTLHTNYCHGNTHKAINPNLKYLRIAVEAADERARLALTQLSYFTLSAVPVNVFNAFIALGGKVVITADADRICKLGGTQDQAFTNMQVRSCVIKVPLNTFKDQPELDGMTLVMLPDSDVVASSSVRAMAQMLTQFAAKKLRGQSDDGLIKFSPERFAILEDQLAASFLLDVANSKVFSLESLSPYLGPEVTTKVRTNLHLVDEHRFSDFIAAIIPKQAPRYQFADFVVNESFDSRHCVADDDRQDDFNLSIVAAAEREHNPKLLSSLTNTHRIFKYFFPHTSAAYDAMDTYLDALSTQIAKDASIAKAQGVPIANTARAGLALGGIRGFFQEARDYSWATLQGVGEGAVNIKNGAVNATQSAGNSLGDFAATTFYNNERGQSGLTAASTNLVSQVKEGIRSSQKAADQRYEDLGGAYANNKISFAQLTLGTVSAAAGPLPIANNATASVDALGKTITGKNDDGSPLTPADQTKLNKQAGGAAGSAIVDVVLAVGTGAVSKPLGDGAVAATRASAASASEGLASASAAAIAVNTGRSQVTSALSSAAGQLADSLSNGSRLARTASEIISDTASQGLGGVVTAGQTAAPNSSANTTPTDNKEGELATMPPPGVDPTTPPPSDAPEDESDT